MKNQDAQTARLIWFLQERAKELSCLYRVEELLQPDRDIGDICRGIIEAIPPGWQYPEICRARIVLENSIYRSPDFHETPWSLSAEIKVMDQAVGGIQVYYLMETPTENGNPFLKEETKLVNTIADRLGGFLTYRKMRVVFHGYRTAAQDLQDATKIEWRVVLDLLRQTDLDLYLRITHKMLNHMCWNGIEEAKALLQRVSPAPPGEEEELLKDANRPHQKRIMAAVNEALSEQTFDIAGEQLGSAEILSLIQKWIQEDKLSFLIKSLSSVTAPASEVAGAIHRYQRMEGVEIPQPAKKGVLVSLIRRFFSDQLDFINIAKHYIEISDMFELMQKVIFMPESHGRLGGKSAGLFLAEKILRRSCEDKELLANLKVPKTWYLASDVVMDFIYYNDLEEVIEQKYKEVNQVRLEYPNVVQTFKNSQFPPEIVKALSSVLDDFEDSPLIVRSSSLLEDRTGAAFSGKYKSLFLANQGEKHLKLAALMDAIAEVYASTFGPDPIGYRAERGLLDFHEEMGIMIQQVVGSRVGKYFLPAYAGVAFSKNELRWSPRIRREDGLVRLVPGLGTRAVDRVADDYPILASPGQPGLRVNVTLEEVIRYSPKQIDVINLETNTFETVRILDLLKQCGNEMPLVQQIMSVLEHDRVRRLSGLHNHFESENYVVTFDGLLSQSPFMGRMHQILKTLEEKLGTAVDIEYAHDGKDFYLLQCRPQSRLQQSAAAVIPQDIPEDRIVFTAGRHVSNGRVPDITHIVYVDPQKYSELTDRASLVAVGRAVSRLNSLLPKRNFILMGPGRWGSRGDIRLGVNVSYSDINNTAVLVEIARKSGQYLPDLSFGTHFFQDLVEAEIRYLPLYPDDPGNVFNERFLLGAPNLLGALLPDYSALEETIRVIDVPSATGGKVLQVLMNADEDRAVGMLGMPRVETEGAPKTRATGELPVEAHWRWRLRMAEHIAATIEAERLGVKALYVFGSTKNSSAGPASDIDLLVHFEGSPQQRELLTAWLDAWSLSLSQMNYLQTGYRTERLLDYHIVTNEDIAARTSWAVKIGAVTDAARPLPLKHK